jgi:hypothetical protein
MSETDVHAPCKAKILGLDMEFAVRMSLAQRFDAPVFAGVIHDHDLQRAFVQLPIALELPHHVEQ